MAFSPHGKDGSQSCLLPYCSLQEMPSQLTWAQLPGPQLTQYLFPFLTSLPDVPLALGSPLHLDTWLAPHIQHDLKLHSPLISIQTYCLG